MLEDIRHALRLFAKNPVLYGVAVLTLAVGIGGNSTIFSLAHAFLAPDLAFSEPERLVMLETVNPRSGGAGAEIPLAGFLALRDGATTLDRLEARRGATVRLTGGDGLPVELSAARTTGGFFRALGVDALRGRVFDEADAQPGAAPTALLDHDTWQRRFGGDPDLVGGRLEIGGIAHTVLGVLPEDFEYFDASIEVYLPLVVDPGAAAADFETWVGAIGRLKTDASVGAAEREIDRLAAGFVARFPEAMEERTLRGRTIDRVFPGDTDRMLVKILMSAVLFVLLIACANIANLLLARGEARRSELATRAALGAGRFRLVRQLLTESVLLASLGGALGIGLAVWGIRYLQATMPADMPRGFVPDLDPAVLAFTAATSLACGLVFGAAQVLFVARAGLAGDLREGARGTASRRRGMLRAALVIGQVCVAVMLLVGTSVMVRVFSDLMLVDTGVDTEGVLTVALERPDDAEPADWTAFYDQLTEHLRSRPGVEAVGATGALPRGQSWTMRRVSVDGQEPPAESEDWPRAVTTPVTPGYLDSLGVGLLAGRDLGPADRADTLPIAVVNRAFAERFFGEASTTAGAIGRRIVLVESGDGATETREIVGVVADFYQRRLTERSGPAPQVFVPFAQAPQPAMTLTLRTEGDPLALVDTVRESVRAVALDQPLGRAVTLERHVEEMTAGPRAVIRIAATLGLLALGLASLGLYGVMAYSVALRRREIGIRLALGSSRGAIIRRITTQGLRLVVVGTILALPGAWGVLRILGSNFETLEVGEYAAAFSTVALLFVVALLASLLPARSASRVPPTETLRG